MAQFLVAVALWEPVVLVLDDLHWTDRDSLQLFAYCGRFVGRAPLVLVGAYRDVPPDLHARHPLVDTLAVVCREASYERITLGGLSHREVARYLAAVNQQARPAPLVSAIHVETGGNPFYVRQLWRHLVDERVVVHRDGRWRHELLLAWLPDVEPFVVPDEAVLHLVSSRHAEDSAAEPRCEHVDDLPGLVDRAVDLPRRDLDRRSCARGIPCARPRLL